MAAHLAQLDADAQLAEAHQFETYNRMTAFVMHDLKNIAAQLRLISQNAERHRRNPEFVDDALPHRRSAANAHDEADPQLALGIEEVGTLQTVDLATLRRACRHALQRPGAVRRSVIAQSRPMVFADTERLTTVIEHAIRNAQDATAARGEIRVEVGERGHRPLLSVIDTGGHGCAVRPRSPVPALRHDQGRARHGYRRIPDARICPLTGRRRGSAVRTRPGTTHSFPGFSEQPVTADEQRGG